MTEHIKKPGQNKYIDRSKILLRLKKNMAFKRRPNIGSIGYMDIVYYTGRLYSIHPTLYSYDVRTERSKLLIMYLRSHIGLIVNARQRKGNTSYTISHERTFNQNF